MRRVIGVLLGAVVVGGASFLLTSMRSPDDEVELTAASARSMERSLPNSGRLELVYVRPSTENADRIDYRLVRTVRWDSEEAFNCYAEGRVDWAYEHEILYGRWFDRKIWNDDLSELANASPYLDTTALDSRDTTTLPCLSG